MNSYLPADQLDNSDGLVRRIRSLTLACERSTFPPSPASLKME